MEAVAAYVNLEIILSKLMLWHLIRVAHLFVVGSLRLAHLLILGVILLYPSHTYIPIALSDLAQLLQAHLFL